MISDSHLGAIGPKTEAEEIYRKIETFLNEELKRKVAQAKSGLKHSTETIRYLGHDIGIRSTEKLVSGKSQGQHYRKRTCKSQRRLMVPEAKLQSFAEKHRDGNWATMMAESIPFLIHASDAEITLHYAAEMRGIGQFYVLANNFHSLSRLRFLWIQSYLKTMASKHQLSVPKVATMLNRGLYMAVREAGKSGKVREIRLFRLKDVKRNTSFGSKVDHPPFTYHYTQGSELLQRMEANQCEYCEKEGGYFEVHHVKKLADIKEGKQPWERLMIARARKTLVLCVECHQKLTTGTLPDRRHLVK